MKGFSLIAILIALGFGIWIWSQSAAEQLQDAAGDSKTKSSVDAAAAAKDLIEQRNAGF